MIKDTTPIYRFTNHFRQRYYERILKEEWKGQSLKDSEIRKAVLGAKEILGWQNDTNLVDYLRERYKTTKFKIFQHEQYIFLAKRDTNITNLYYMMTCFEPTSTYYTTKLKK